MLCQLRMLSFFFIYCIYLFFAEADVHTKETLGVAAATWANSLKIGWVATAVAAKFYRSQSDTGRPQRPPLTGKAKPASLGMLEYLFENILSFSYNFILRRRNCKI